MKKSWEELAYEYALDNAILHEGKAQEGAVLGHLFREGLKKEEIGKIMPIIKEQIKKINSMKTEQQKAEFEQYKKKFDKQKEEKIEAFENRELPELPNAGKKMVLRLAPYPSGALHLGNAKTYLLNALYAEKYKAKLLLVIDDTIGSKEKKIAKEAYKLIPEAWKWLNVKYSKPVYYKSSRMAIYYKYAEELIKLNKAYVCSCAQEVLRENREQGRECSCRNLPYKEQKERWKKMFKAKPGTYTLRLKTNMQDSNPAFRDRVLFKISDAIHPKVGRKYSVWPTLEMTWSIDDHLLGITHIIRGKDLMIETDMEKFMWDIFGWKHPETIHVGLVRIEGIGAKLSKSKAQKEVESGEFSGWDDPRTWSVQSLKRRGFLPEAIRDFVKDIGLNQNDIVVPIDKLYAINRKLIDKNAKRYFFIKDPVELEISKNPGIQEIEVKIHPDMEETRKIKIGNDIFIARKDFDENKNKEIRLMHLFNVKLGKNPEFTSVENKEIPRVQWVSDFVKVRILMDDGNWIEGIGEIALKKLKKNDVIQFERFGFVRFDRINEAGVYEFWFTHG